MGWNDKQVGFASLKGQTLVSIEGATKGSEEIILRTMSQTLKMYHDQGCCESVSVEDVCGDIADLIGSPLTMAEEVSSAERPADVAKPDYEPESQTWTFYKAATIKGSVTIRWLGESNGYYSEGVSVCEVEVCA